MKICKIYIRDFEQFQNVDLDFTDPETGMPLNKICFIGSNGTGKSKILELILWYLNIFNGGFKSGINAYNLSGSLKGKILFQILHKSNIYFVYCETENLTLFRSNRNTGEHDELANKIITEFNHNKISEDFWKELTKGLLHEDFIRDFQLRHNDTDLVIYSPAESSHNGYKDIKDVPETNVSEALSLSKYLPYNAKVSSDKVNVFWKLLVYNIRKRAEEREIYENLSINLNKTKQQLIETFDSLNPKILADLGKVWNKILNKAGLYFDEKGASNPYQLTDNLKAYIKLKSNNQIIPYSELSTGIRNYIFRLGHIFSLYFNREVDRAFLLIDEPENSLYPDFLFDLMEMYNHVLIDKRGENNTQLFFSTHNPIIAAQFKPYERIILSWKEDGCVSVNKGISPEGDDPNDMLKKDFGLHQLMGHAGIMEWNKYLNLKKQLKKEDSREKKMDIAAEINKVGQLYNFPA